MGSIPHDVAVDAASTMPTSSRRDSAARRQRAEGLFAVRRRDIVAILVVGLTQAALLVAFVVLIAMAIDGIQPAAVGAEAARIYRNTLITCGVLAALAGLIGLTRAAEFAIAEKAGYEVVRKLRMQMYDHLLRMRPDHLRHRARGGLLLRLTGDLSMLRMWLSRGLLEGLVAIIVLVAGIGATAYLNVWLALAMTACLFLTAALSLGSGRAMRAATRTMRRRRSLVMGNIDEQINALAVVQTAGRARGEHARLSRQNDSLTRALVRVAELRARLRGIAAFGSALVTAAVVAMGTVEVHRGTATLGEVVATVMVARYLARPIRTLGLSHDYWHRGLVSRGKVLDFLLSSARPETDAALERLRAPRGLVELDAVTVPGRLHQVSATAFPREIIGITGPAGSGASDLLHVLARLDEPVSGEVRIDGQSLAETSSESAPRRIGIASRDLPLMRGTIRRNLTYARPRAEAADVQRVAYLLGIDEILERHAGTLRSWVTEGGANLPAGDRQLIALGRAMLGNPRLLLLDEPMQGLDAERRERVRSAVRHHEGTVFMVSHDEADLSMADQVWMMKDGQIIDTLTGEQYRDHLWMTGRAAWPAQAGI